MLRLGADEPGQVKWAWSGVFQWPEWWRMREYNWVNFYPLRIGVEAGSYKGRYVEAEFVVLGVGFVLEVYHAPGREAFAAPFHEKMEKLDSGEAGLLELQDCEHCDGMGSVFMPPEEDS